VKVKKKYTLIRTGKTTVFGRPLFQVKALFSFGIVRKGELGGFIEKEKNLSQEGKCWVYGDACVCGDACVSGDAWVCGDAWVSGDARVYGDALVYGNAWVSGDALVSGMIDLNASINVEIPRILLDTKEKVEKYLKMLEEFVEK